MAGPQAATRDPRKSKAGNQEINGRGLGPRKSIARFKGWAPGSSTSMSGLQETRRKDRVTGHRTPMVGWAPGNGNQWPMNCWVPGYQLSWFLGGNRSICSPTNLPPIHTLAAKAKFRIVWIGNHLRLGEFDAPHHSAAIVKI